MSTARLTRAQRREQTREHLLEAARAMFIERGFASTSLQEIAESAGYTRGAFYSNFEDKQTLLLEILTRDLDSVLAKISADEHGESALVEAGSADAMPPCRISLDHDFVPVWVEATLLAYRDKAFREKLNAVRCERLEKLGKAVRAVLKSVGQPTLTPPEILGLGVLSLRASVQLFEICAGKFMKEDAGEIGLAELIRLIRLQLP